MIKNIAFFILTVTSSNWFLPVSFFGGARLGMALICVQQGCSRDIFSGEEAHKYFTVIVEKYPSGKIVAVLLQDLPVFLKLNPSSSLLLKNTKGTTNDNSWEYNVESISSTIKVVDAHHIDGNRIDVKYKVIASEVVPLYSRIMSSGYVFLSVPFGLLVAWAIRILSIKFKLKINF